MINKEILRRARSYIENGWTQSCCARDKNGNSVMYRNQEAVSFCLIGSIRRAIADDMLLPMSSALDLRPVGAILRDVKNNMNLTLPTWNDSPTRTKQEVLDFLDLAIEQVPE